MGREGRLRGSASRVEVEVEGEGRSGTVGFEGLESRSKFGVRKAES